MAESKYRLPQNVPGTFYVDETCIDCDLCRSTAPAFFQRHDPTGYSYVHRQPATIEELNEAEEARLSCPSESIGREDQVNQPPSYFLAHSDHP